MIGLCVCNSWRRLVSPPCVRIVQESFRHNISALLLACQRFLRDGTFTFPGSAERPLATPLLAAGLVGIRGSMGSERVIDRDCASLVHCLFCRRLQQCFHIWNTSIRCLTLTLFVCACAAELRHLCTVCMSRFICVLIQELTQDCFRLAWTLVLNPGCCPWQCSVGFNPYASRKLKVLVLAAIVVSHVIDLACVPRHADVACRHAHCQHLHGYGECAAFPWSTIYACTWHEARPCTGPSSHASVAATSVSSTGCLSWLCEQFCSLGIGAALDGDPATSVGQWTACDGHACRHSANAIYSTAGRTRRWCGGSRYLRVHEWVGASWLRTWNTWFRAWCSVPANL